DTHHHPRTTPTLNGFVQPGRRLAGEPIVCDLGPERLILQRVLQEPDIGELRKKPTREAAEEPRGEAPPVQFFLESSLSGQSLGPPLSGAPAGLEPSVANSS